MLSSAHSSSQNVPIGLFADPTFRRDLAADPVATLAAHGIKVRESDLPAEIRLPNLDDLGRMSADSENGNGNGPPADPPGNGNGPPSDDLGGFFWTLFLN